MCSCKPLLHNFYFRLYLTSFHAFLSMKIKLPADVTLWKYFLPFESLQVLLPEVSTIVIIACRPLLNEWSSGGEQFRSCHGCFTQ